MSISNSNKDPRQNVPPTLKLRALPTPFAVQSVPSSLTKTVQVDGENAFPCRRCLQDGKMGDFMLLAPYDPWLGDSPYRQTGPIFVHSTPQCAPYKPDGLLPQQLRRRLISVRCFDSAHCLVGADVVQGDELMRVSAKMMENEKAEYIHVHYARPGCFAVRIDRA
ncbi:hypothetical protein E5D57_002801 [Metarhizium anisopliae]|nr:hypothetical protein E5D57_002801 [Metarhizium anisopliae]